MAVSLGFGVLFATGITLLLVPCGYVILDDIDNLLNVKKAGNGDQRSEGTRDPTPKGE
jgi:hypothetical protein